jgi:hypothetical protein
MRLSALGVIMMSSTYLFITQRHIIEMVVSVSVLHLILEEPRLVGNLRQLRTQPLVLRSDFCILCKFLSQHCFLFLVMRQCLRNIKRIIE